ncbi:Uncharacterised protein [Vibrio cholerae]|nr:Uncharacterised protein [Vibrio cholerae]CSB39638.1 Uncharacterised protein [Vibrio cholerae]CSB73220.1 Uncharacterised protein [Vibrio cholerae]
MFAQFINDIKQRFGFGIGQRIGRFIHDDNFRFKRQRFGNFHHLLLTQAQLSEQGFSTVFHIQTCEQLIRFTMHFIPQNASEWRSHLTAKENIFRNRQLRDQVELLVNNADARQLRISWAFKTDRLALILNAARIFAINAGQNFHQG